MKYWMEYPEIREFFNKFPDLYEQCEIGFTAKGWYDIIYQLSKDIQSLEPKAKVLQVKEKFGLLRFYYVVPADCERKEDIAALVHNAETESSFTCEFCGSKYNVTTEGKYWLKTLCPKCRNELEDKRKMMD